MMLLKAKVELLDPIYICDCINRVVSDVWVFVSIWVYVSMCVQLCGCTCVSAYSINITRHIHVQPY